MSGLDPGTSSTKLKDSANFKNARRIVDRMYELHGHAALQAMPCATQTNSFDCGVYSLVFASVVVTGFVESSNPSAFRLASAQWRKRLESIDAHIVTAYRASLRKDFSNAGKNKTASVVDDTCFVCGSCTLQPTGVCWDPSCPACGVSFQTKSCVRKGPRAQASAVQKKPAIQASVARKVVLDMPKGHRAVVPITNSSPPPRRRQAPRSRCLDKTHRCSTGPSPAV